MPTRAALFVMFILGAMVGGVAAPARGQSADPVKRGAEVYKEQKCQMCHSIEGVGNKKTPLDGVASRRTDEEIRKWIVSPKEMNPKVVKRGYDKLPKADLDALVAYLKTVKSK